MGYANDFQHLILKNAAEKEQESHENWLHIKMEEGSAPRKLSQSIDW